jgi:putative transposase
VSIPIPTWKDDHSDEATPAQSRTGLRTVPEGERLLNEGTDLTEVSRHLETSEATWNRWPAQYAGMKGEDMKRLRELESENKQMKKLVADQALDIDMLEEVARGNF